jgi:hypothetical protein
MRDYAESLPSMEEQAMVNLLGIKGGAKRAFAESTLSLMAGLTPQQYHQKMVSEIQRVIPLLEQTISSFSLTDPREIKVYQDMVARLRQGVGVDWSKFHAIHSAVKPSQPKQTVTGYADGVVSVPGPKGKGDVVPAMLSPGEAVIPADKASKYAGLIQEMIYGKIPGYSDSNVKRISQTAIAKEFGQKGGTSLNASHTTSFVPERVMQNLAEAAARLGSEVEDITVTVIEHTRAIDAEGKAITESRTRSDGSVVQEPVINREAKQMPLSEALASYKDFSMVMGGASFGATAIPESATRNQRMFPFMSRVQDAADPRNIGELGSPETLQDVEYHGELASRALIKFADKLTDLDKQVLQNMIEEGKRATEKLASSNAAQEELDYVINQRRQGLELRLDSDTGIRDDQKQAKRQANEERLAQITEQYYKEIAEGISSEDALQKAKDRLMLLVVEQSQAVGEATPNLFVGGEDINSNILRDSSKKSPNNIAFNDLNAMPVIKTGRSVNEAAAARVMDEIKKTGVIFQGTLEEVKQFASKTMIGLLEKNQAGFIQGARDFAQINSPSDRTDDTIGRPLVEGMEAGALSGKDDMQQAGAILAETAADSAAATASSSRRVTRPVTDTARYSASQTGLPMSGPRRSTREGDLEKRQREAAEAAEALGRVHRLEAQASLRSSNAMLTQARSAEESASRMSSMNSMLMNGTFAISSLSGVLSMFGGEFAELNQTIFGVTTAMFALMQITQMLTQAKVLEIAKSRFSLARNAAFGPQIGPKTLAQSATGFGANIAKAGMFVLRFLGPIGIATTLLTIFGGAIAFAIDQENKRKQALEGLAKTANLASEQLDMLASEFSVTRNKVDFSSPASPSAQDDVAITPKDLAKNEEFLKKFETQIAGIKGATAEAVNMALEGLSLQLEAEGFAPEAIKTITEGLLQAAGRTDVKLKFFKITATGEIELDVDTQKSANLLIENYKAAFDKSAAASGSLGEDYGNTTGKGFWSTFWNSFMLSQAASLGGGQAIALSPVVGMDADTGELTAGITGLTEEAKTRLAELSAYFTSAFSNIRAQLDNGSITVEEYNLQLSTLFTSLNSLSDAELAPIVPALAESMGITDEVDKFTNQIDKVLKLKAAVAGVDIGAKDIETLNKGGAAAIGVRKKLNNEIVKQAENLKTVVAAQEAEALIDENYGAAVAGLNDKVIALQNQSEAYQFLIDQGYDAETAFELAGDAGLAAGIKAAMGAGVGSQKWKDLKAILDQVIGLEKNAPKGPGGAGDKTDYQKTIESLQDQRKEIINNNIAFNKLRQAGFDTANAMKAAEDPITAAALASTKVGTDKWNKLISSIKQTQALLSKKEIQELLRGGKVEIADKKAQAVVSTALSRLGYTAEQLDEILSDQEFTNTLAKDLKDGSINSQDLLNRLSQIKQLGNLDVVVNLTTKEGAAEEFQKKYDKVVGYLQAKQQTIEIGFQLKTAADRTIVREAEDLIAAIQYKIDDYEAELVGIEEQEELINEKYNDRKEALDKIAKANDSIAKQQKGQLSLADALSKGDMAAAAQAVQDIRAQQAEDSVAGQGDLLEASKERELAAIRSSSGKSRKKLEEDIKKLKKDIFDIEEKTLEPARENIRVAEAKKAAELASLDAQILKWEELAAKVNEAKLKLTPEEMTAMETQAGLIADMLENWDDISDKTAILTIVKKTIGEVTDGNTTNTTNGSGSGGNGSGNGSGSGSPTSSNPTGGLSTAGFINQTDQGTPARIPGKPTSDAGIGKTWQLDSTNTWRAVTSPKPPYNPGIGNTWYWDTFTDTWRIQPIAKPAPNVGVGQNPGMSYPAPLSGNSTGTKPAPSIYSFAKKLAVGGSVAGPGTSTSDSIPAMLSDGEFVVRASSVDKLGTGFLNFINQNGQIPKFATGGFVSLQDRMAAAKKEDNKVVGATLAKKEAEKLAAQRLAAITADKKKTSSVMSEKSKRDQLYQQGGFQGFEAGFQGMMADIGKNDIVKAFGEAYSADNLGGQIFRGALGALSIPSEITGSLAKSVVESIAAAQRGDFLGAVGTAVSSPFRAVYEGLTNPFSGVVDASKAKATMFEQAAQSAIDNNFFGAATNPEMAALARIIGGGLNIFGDPTTYLGLGAVKGVAKAGLRAGAKAGTKNASDLPPITKNTPSTKPKPNLIKDLEWLKFAGRPDIKAETAAMKAEQAALAQQTLDFFQATKLRLITEGKITGADQVIALDELAETLAKTDRLSIGPKVEMPDNLNVTNIRDLADEDLIKLAYDVYANKVQGTSPTLFNNTSPGLYNITTGNQRRYVGFQNPILNRLYEMGIIPTTPSLLRLQEGMRVANQYAPLMTDIPQIGPLPAVMLNRFAGNSFVSATSDLVPGWLRQTPILNMLGLNSKLGPLSASIDSKTLRQQPSLFAHEYTHVRDKGLTVLSKDVVNQRTPVGANNPNLEARARFTDFLVQQGLGGGSVAPYSDMVNFGTMLGKAANQEDALTMYNRYFRPNLGDGKYASRWYQFGYDWIDEYLKSIKQMQEYHSAQGLPGSIHTDFDLQTMSSTAEILRKVGLKTGLEPDRIYKFLDALESQSVSPDGVVLSDFTIAKNNLLKIHEQTMKAGNSSGVSPEKAVTSLINRPSQYSIMPSQSVSMIQEQLRNRAAELAKQVDKMRQLKLRGISYKLEDLGSGKTRLSAEINGQEAGHMDFYKFDEGQKGREVLMAYTNDQFRGQGVATALFNTAKLMGLKPMHSLTLSSDGRGFAGSIGGRSVVPRNLGVLDRERVIGGQEQVVRDQLLGRIRAQVIADAKNNPDKYPGIDLSNPKGINVDESGFVARKSDDWGWDLGGTKVSDLMSRMLDESSTWDPDFRRMYDLIATKSPDLDEALERDPELWLEAQEMFDERSIDPSIWNLVDSAPKVSVRMSKRMMEIEEALMRARNRFFSAPESPEAARGGFVVANSMTNPIRRAMGGMVKPKYFNTGGLALGTDIVPSMLTPGEFVMSKYAVQNYGLDKMKAINSGTYNGDSMYNYEINVNVQTDANADQIAKAVIGQIKHIDSQKIRGNRF